ncbi:MAG TPA: hypothetical protein PK961_12575 [bacterium]|nr:hypothetical protein [bacterium]
MRRLWLVLLFLPLVAVAADYAVDGGVDRAQFVRFNDFGATTDFEANMPVYFPKPPENYELWGMKDGAYVRYENPKRFYWVTKPSNPGAYTTARVIKSYYAAKVRLAPVAGARGRGALAIRYKDNLLAPVSVHLHTSKGWTQIGALGGKFDHAWKVATLPFDFGAAAVESGTWLAQIGSGAYGDLRGDLPVDWIGLALKNPTVPAPTPGFWPTPAPSKFPKLAKTMSYAPGQPPVFIAGVLVKGMRVGSWKTFADAHANSIIYQGWETKWKRLWEVYAADKYQDRVRAGFPDWMEECAKNKLLCTSQFFTDTRSYFIERQYGNEYEVLDTLGEVMKFNARAAGNLCWYLKDEADHNDESWGSPPEYLLQLWNLQKMNDPDRPAAILFQGWKPGAFAAFNEMMDIAAFDVYPLGAGRAVTEISDRIERMRAEVGSDKALWAVIEAHEGEHVRNLGRQLTKDETLVQGYLSLAHDVHGVFYYICNEAAYIDVAEMPGPWAGMKQFFAEVNGPGGIAHWFLPGSVTLARTGLPSNRAAVDDSAIHFVYKRDAQNRSLLVAVNTSRHAKEAEFVIGDLPALTGVQVLFENRTLTAKNNGSLSDSFQPYERHVYRW